MGGVIGTCFPSLVNHGNRFLRFGFSLIVRTMAPRLKGFSRFVFLRRKPRKMVHIASLLIRPEIGLLCLSPIPK